jgi:hypothetical protein
VSNFDPRFPTTNPDFRARLNSLFMDADLMKGASTGFDPSSLSGQEIVDLLPGIGVEFDTEVFAREYDRRVAEINEEGIDTMDNFFEAFGEEMFRHEDAMHTIKDLNFNPFTGDPINDAEVMAARMAMNRRRALEMKDSGYFTTVGRALGESFNEMIITRAEVQAAGTLAGFIGGPKGAAAGFVVTAPAAIAAGFVRLGDRVFHQALLQYQDEVITENIRRRRSGEELMQYDSAIASQRAFAAAGAEVAMEAATFGFSRWRKGRKAAKAAAQRVEATTEALDTFKDAELSVLKAGSRQQIRKAAKSIRQQAGAEFVEESGVGFLNDVSISAIELAHGEYTNADRFDFGDYLHDGFIGMFSGSAFGGYNYVNQTASSMLSSSLNRRALGPAGRRARDRAAEAADINSGAVEVEAEEFSALDAEGRQERIDETQTALEEASERSRNARQKANDLLNESSDAEGETLEENDAKIEEQMEIAHEAELEAARLGRNLRLYNEVFGEAVQKAPERTVEEHLGQMSKPKTDTEEGAAATTAFSEKKEGLTAVERGAIALGKRLGVSVKIVEGGQNTANDGTPAWYARDVKTDDGSPVIFVRSQSSLAEVLSKAQGKDTPSDLTGFGSLYMRGLVLHETIHAVQFFNPKLYRKMREMMDDGLVAQAAREYFGLDPYEVDIRGRRKGSRFGEYAALSAATSPGTKALIALLSGANPDPDLLDPEVADAAAIAEVEGTARLVEDGASRFDGKVQTFLARIGLLGQRAKVAANVLRVLEAAAAEEGGLVDPKARTTPGGSRSTLLAAQRVEKDSDPAGEIDSAVAAARAELQAEKEAKEAAAQEREDDMLDGLTPEEVDEELEDMGVTDEETDGEDTPEDSASIALGLSKARIVVATNKNLISENLDQFYGNTDEDLRIPLYHGTVQPYAENDVFDPTRGDMGVHLSADPVIASYFATRLTDPSARVYPLVARMESPIHLVDTTNTWTHETLMRQLLLEKDIPLMETAAMLEREQDAAFVDVVQSKMRARARGASLISQGHTKEGMDFLYQLQQILEKEGPEAAAAFVKGVAKKVGKRGSVALFSNEVYNRQMQRVLQSMGHDSVVYVNRAEMIDPNTGLVGAPFLEGALHSIAIGFGQSRQQLQDEIESDADFVARMRGEGYEPSESYIVFESNHLKSAIGNNGSFSLDRASGGDSISRARVIYKQDQDFDIDTIPSEENDQLRAAALAASDLELEEIRHTEWVRTMRRSPHANTLTIPTAVEFAEKTKSGEPRYRAYRIPGTQVVYALKRIEKGDDTDAPDFDGYEWTGLVSNEPNLTNVVPIIAGHAILTANGKPVRGDYFDVRKPGARRGKLPTLYSRLGFVATQRFEFALQYIVPENFPAQLDAWIADGWQPEYNYDETNPEPEPINGRRVPSNLPAVEYAVLDGLTEAELDAVRSGGLRAWADIVARKPEGTDFLRRRDRSQVAGDGTQGVREGRPEQRDVGGVPGEPGTADRGREGREPVDEGTGRRAEDGVRADAGRPVEQQRTRVDLSAAAIRISDEMRHANLAEAAAALIGADLLPDAKWYELYDAWKESETDIQSDAPEAVAFREYANAHARSIGLTGRLGRNGSAEAGRQRKVLLKLLNLRSMGAAGRIQTLAGITGDPKVDQGRVAELYATALAMGIVHIHNNNQLRTAEDWYGRTIRGMNKILHSRVPGLKSTHPNHKENRVVFSLMLAIMSNGETIERNMTKAIDAFEHWQETGEFRSPPGYRSMGTDPLITIQQLREAFDSWEEVLDWMKTPGSIKEVNARIKAVKARLQAEGKKHDAIKLVTTELVDQPGYNALTIGPKIGAFFLNMNEEWNPVTMDVWFTRTIARMLGISEVTDAQVDFKFYARLLDMRSHLGMNRNQHKDWIRERVVGGEKRTVDAVFRKIEAGTATKKDIDKLVALQKKYQVKSGKEKNTDQWTISVHKYNPDYVGNENRLSVLGEISKKDGVSEDFDMVLERDMAEYKKNRYKESDPLREVVLVAMNQYVKADVAEARDPKTANNRAALRDITKQAVAKANAELGEGTVTNASAQANLWYLEKGIYFAMIQSGAYGDPREQDFEVAADKVTRAKGYYDEGMGDTGMADPAVSKARANPFFNADPMTATDVANFNDVEAVEDEEMELLGKISRARITKRPELERELRRVETKLQQDEVALAEAYGIAPFMDDSIRDLVQEQKDLLAARVGPSPALAAQRGLTAGLAAAKAVALAERQHGRQRLQERLKAQREDANARREKAMRKVKDRFKEQKQKARAEKKAALAKLTKKERARREAALDKALEGRIKALDAQQARAEAKLDRVLQRHDMIAQHRAALMDLIMMLPKAERATYIRRLAKENITASEVIATGEDISRAAARVDQRIARRKVDAKIKKMKKRKMKAETRASVLKKLDEARKQAAKLNKGMTVEQIEEATANANELLAEANAEYESDAEAIRDNKNERGQEILSRIERVVAFFAGEESAKKLGRAVGTSRKGELHAGLGRNGALDLKAALTLVGLGGDHNLLTHAEDRKKLDSRVLIETVNEIVKKHGFQDLGDFMAQTTGSKGLGRLRFKEFVYRDENGDTQTITLTLGQALKLVALDGYTMEELRKQNRKNPDAMQELAFQNVVDPTAEGETIRGKDLAADIETFRVQMQAEEAGAVAVVGELKGVRNKMLKPKAMFALFRLTGVTPPTTDDYEPRKVKARTSKASDPRQQEEAVGKLGGGGVGMQFAENAGMTKERVGGGVTMVGDVMTDFLEHSEAALNLAHMAEPTRILWSALNDPESSAEIERVLGSEYLRNLRLQVAYGSGLITPSLNNSALGNIVAVTTGTAIAVNIGTWIRVLGGGINNLLMSEHMTFADLTTGLTRALALGMQGKLHDFMEEEVYPRSGYLWDRDHASAVDRRVVFTRDDGLASEKDVTSFMDIMQSVGQSVAGMMDALSRKDNVELKQHLKDIRKAIASMPKAVPVLRYLDRFIAATAVLSRGEAGKLTKDDLLKASEIMRDTQNTSSPLDDARSTVVMRTRNEFLAYLLTFSSDPLKTQSRLLDSPDTATSLKRNLVSVVGNGTVSVVANVITTSIILSLLGDDDEEYDVVLEELQRQRLADGIDKTFVAEFFARRYGILGFMFSRVAGDAYNEVENAVSQGRPVSTTFVEKQGAEAFTPIGVVQGTVGILSDGFKSFTEPDEAKRAGYQEDLFYGLMTYPMGIPIAPLARFINPIFTETTRAEVRSAAYQLQKLGDTDDLPPEVKRAIKKANKEYQTAKKKRERAK